MGVSKKPAVLIVDDEPEILKSLLGLLRREFDLHVAESGEQALQILAENPIQVVMTDQRMPGMTGVELMSHVRRHSPDAVRIVFTGYADIKAVIEAINSGGLFRYLTKPWDPDELVEVLKDAAAKYRKLAEKKVVLADVCNVLAESGDAAHAVLLDRVRQLMNDDFPNE